jgi:RNA polymerase sigma-70 factor, ECF subfamily
MMTVPDSVPARRTVPAVAAPGASRPASVVDLLDLHGAEVYRHLRRLTPTADDAADLHQETFLRAHRAWASLPPDANHRAWIHRIAANVAVDAHRRRAARGGAEAAPIDAGGASPGSLAAARGPAVTAPEPAAGPRTDPALAAEGSALREAVRDALAALPDRERRAVIARVLEGRDPSDVAGLLDCTETNARQITSRGLRRLRSLLAPHLETDR